MEPLEVETPSIRESREIKGSRAHVTLCGFLLPRQYALMGGLFIFLLLAFLVPIGIACFRPKTSAGIIVQKEYTIMIGMEADLGLYNNIDAKTNLLVGFDVELTRLICDAIHEHCAVVTSPFHSMVPPGYPDLGWPDNEKVFPGKGFLDGWFHCASGNRNSLERQNSFAFSDPYTDPSSDTLVFVGRSGVVHQGDTAIERKKMIEGKTIGVQHGFAPTFWFKANRNEFQPGEIVEKPNQKELFLALTEEKSVDYVLYAKSDVFHDTATEVVYEIPNTPEPWQFGMGYMCHPSRYDIVEKLNRGLKEIKRNGKYSELCNKKPYSGKIPCDLSSDPMVFRKNHWPFMFQNAVHDTITIAMEADLGHYNGIDEHGVLVGFDVDLTKLICDAVKVNCAVVTSPFLSMIPKSLEDLGWKENTKVFPGVGFLEHWFDCASGNRNTQERRNSLAFTDPYTDPDNDFLVFYGRSGEGHKGMNSIKGKVAGQKGFAATFWLKSHKEEYGLSEVIELENQDSLFAALKDRTVDFVIYAEKDVHKQFLSMAWLEKVLIAHTGPDSWAFGVSYMCHPRSYDVVATLNRGLAIVKQTGKYEELCRKPVYDGHIPCRPQVLEFKDNQWPLQT